MNIEELISLYKCRASEAKPAVLVDTVLGITAREILEMVTCYSSDAAVFYKQGDLVNAFAASEYGLGWLDAGVYLGYVQDIKNDSHDFDGCVKLEKEFPKDLFPKLEEKTHRYKRMLTEALDSVVAAPDSETGCFVAVEKILVEARTGLLFGTACLEEENDLVNALAFFSYGYGWLDCGVRGGLFQITGNRHLFTI